MNPKLEIFPECCGAERLQLLPRNSPALLACLPQETSFAVRASANMLNAFWENSSPQTGWPIYQALICLKQPFSTGKVCGSSSEQAEGKDFSWMLVSSPSPKGNLWRGFLCCRRGACVGKDASLLSVPLRSPPPTILSALPPLLPQHPVWQLPPSSWGSIVGTVGLHPSQPEGGNVEQMHSHCSHQIEAFPPQNHTSKHSCLL